MAIRDFIPDGDSLTPEETNRFSAMRNYREGEDIIPNFIPDPNDWHAIDPEDGHRRAEEAADRAESRGIVETFERARKHLAELPEVPAVDIIRTLSSMEMNVYLIAEQHGARRPHILSSFPTPDPAFEQRLRAEGALPKAKPRSRSEARRMAEQTKEQE